MIAWKQFEETFKPICGSWNEYNDRYFIKYNELKWVIDNDMLKNFGSEIEVKKTDSKDYIYRQKWLFLS